jgi:hypothetical protein
MDLWVFFLLLALACFAIGMSVSLNKTAARQSGHSDRALQPYSGPQTPQEIVMLPNITLPAQWDELAITRQLRQLREQRPALIPHFIDSVKERWVLRQDDRTASIRLQFLKIQIEQLKLAKEFQQVRDDLDLLILEKAKRIKTLELDLEELDSKKRTRGPLDELAAMKERKKMELEIAQLDKQITDLKTPLKSEPQLTPEQQRAKDKAACEARIATLKQEKQVALKIEDEAERVLRVNALDDAIQREYERWSRLL